MNKNTINKLPQTKAIIINLTLITKIYSSVSTIKPINNARNIEVKNKNWKNLFRNGGKILIIVRVKTNTIIEILVDKLAKNRELIIIIATTHLGKKCGKYIIDALSTRFKYIHEYRRAG